MFNNVGGDKHFLRKPLWIASRFLLCTFVLVYFNQSSGVPFPFLWLVAILIFSQAIEFGPFYTISHVSALCPPLPSCLFPLSSLLRHLLLSLALTVHSTSSSNQFQPSVILNCLAGFCFIQQYHILYNVRHVLFFFVSFGHKMLLSLLY